MKPLYCIILALSTTLVCADMSSAQERMFGKGRFLKRLRDDIMKTQEKKPQTGKQAKTPTPATKGKTPPIVKGKTPTPAARPNPNTLRTNPYASRNASPAVRTPQARTQTPSTRNPYTRPTPPAVKRPSKDFGMAITKDKNDNYIVARVDPNGNAAKVGIRPGDKIVEMGGAPITTDEEIESITEFLKPGDQMEFTIETRGKSRKQLVEWGQAPDDAGDSSAAQFENDVNANDTLRSVLDTKPASRQVQTAKAKYPNQDSLNRTIIDQRRKIQALERQLEQQRREQLGSQRPVPPIIQGPSISGPGR